MQLLTPFSALMLSAASIPVLVLLYVLRLRRRPERIASTLLWARSVEDLRVNTPFQKLRASWLFLLQLLILLLVLLAFAQPVIEGGATNATRVILLIDRSASMNTTTGEDRTRLDDAIEQANDTLGRLGGLDRAVQVMVIAFAGDARIVSGFETDTSLLRQSIASISPTDEPGDLARALQVAGAFAMRRGDDAEVEAPATEVFLFSDGCAARAVVEDDLQLDAGSLRLVQTPRLVDWDETDINVGITTLSAQRDADDPTIVRLFVRLNAVITEPVDALLTIDAEDGSSIVRRVTIEHPANVSSNEGGASHLAEATITVPIRAPEATVIVVHHDVEDALAADDTAALVVAEPTRPRILIVTGDPTTADDDSASTAVDQDAASTAADSETMAGDPPPEDAPADADQSVDPFLLDVLDAFEPDAIDIIDFGRYQVMVEQGSAAAFADASGAAYDCVVFDRVSAKRLPPIPSLTLGGAPGPLAEATVTDDANADAEQRDSGQRILSWDRTDPIMRHVNLEEVVFSGFRAYELPASAKTLARGRYGPVIASFGTRATPHVAVGFSLGRSNWAIEISSAVFFTNVLEQLTRPGIGAPGRPVQPGQTITAAALPGYDQVRIERPNGQTITIDLDADVVVRRQRLSLPRLSHAGLYKTAGLDIPLETLAVSVVSEHETNIRPIEQLRVNARALDTLAASNVAPKPLWHWVLLTAAVLLMLEWLVYCAKVRKTG